MEQNNTATVQFNELPYDIITEILYYLNTGDLFQSAFTSQNIRKCIVSSQILKLRDRLFDEALFNVDKQEYDIAVATIGRLLILFPGDPDALQERAFNYKDKEMIVRGLFDLRMAHKTARDEAHHCFIRAQQHWLKNECQRSYEEIDRAIKLHPKPRYYHFRGFIFSTLAVDKDKEEDKNVKAEINDYEYILNNFMDYKRIAVVYNNLAYVCFDQQRYEEAKKYFEISTRMAPHHVRSYYNTALMNAELGDFAVAIDHVNNILKINPKLCEIRALSGWCYSGLGKDEESTEEYAVALTRTYCEPNSVGPSFTVMIYWGRIARALEESENCVRKIYTDLERIGRQRRKIAELMEGPYKSLNDGLQPEDSGYIDPYFDVNKKEVELKGSLKKLSRYRADMYLQMGDISAAAVDYTKFVIMSKEQSTDEKAVFLDGVFTSDLIKLSLISDAARNLVGKFIGGSRRGQIYSSVRDNLGADVRLEAIDDIKFFLLGFAYRAFNFVMPFAEEHTLAMNIVTRMLNIVDTCYTQKSIKTKAVYFALTFPSLSLLLFMKYMEHHDEAELDPMTQVALLKSFLAYKGHESLSKYKKELEDALDRVQ